MGAAWICSIESRLDALKRQLRASRGANVVVIKGGLPNNDPTEAEIAEAVRKSKAEGGRLVVIGGLFSCDNWCSHREAPNVKKAARPEMARNQGRNSQLMRAIQASGPSKTAAAGQWRPQCPAKRLTGRSQRLAPLTDTQVRRTSPRQRALRGVSAGR